LVHENESVVNIHKHLCAVYESCAVDRSTVGRWAKRVKASGSAQTKHRDLPRAGRPATANSADMLNRVDAIIRADRSITTQQMALQLWISTGSVCFQRVRSGKNPAEMLLQHDNARPHTSLRTW
jgi:transposase